MEEIRKFYEIYDLDTEEYENINIDSADFSVRVNNRLHRAGIETVGALLECTHNKLADLNGFGAGCFKEIYEYLENLQRTMDFAKERASVIDKKVLPKSIYENVNSIIAGDFSFALNEEDSKELIDEYKEAQWILGIELAKKCMDNPNYMGVLRRVLFEFSESMVLAEKAIQKLPHSRRGKKL